MESVRRCYRDCKKKNRRFRVPKNQTSVVIILTPAEVLREFFTRFPDDVFRRSRIYILYAAPTPVGRTLVCCALVVMDAAAEDDGDVGTRAKNSAASAAAEAEETG